MNHTFTKAANNAINLAVKAARVRKQDHLGSEYLLVGLIHETGGMAAQVLEEYNITGDTVHNLIQELYLPSGSGGSPSIDRLTPEAEAVIESAARVAARLGRDEIGTGHLLMGIIENSGCTAARFIKGFGIDTAKMYASILQATGDAARLSEEEKKAIKNGEKMHVSKTKLLDKFSQNITQKAVDGELDPLIGREDELARVMQILSRRTKNNPCLIGEPGVGKTAIVEGLAQRIAMETVPDHLLKKKIYNLDLSAMVAGTKYRGEFEERIKGVLHEVEQNQNIILFIDEIHTMVGAGSAEGSMDASNIMKPALSRGGIQVIGATTVDEYRKYIEKDAALERRFQPVSVEEPSQEQTIHILEGLKPHYEVHHGVEITREGVEAAANLSVRYINDRFLPDKAIDLMDEAASKTRLKGYTLPRDLNETRDRIKVLDEKLEKALKADDLKSAMEINAEKKEKQNYFDTEMQRFRSRMSKQTLTVGPDEIAAVVADWTHIPVQKLTESESHRLQRLEKVLHKRVIAQEEAVTAVSKAVRRGRVGLQDPSRPIGSFLFLGPTGVGKTEISKALAEAVFGTEDAMIRVDMSEYMEKHSVSKMIGSPPGYVGYEEGGQFSEKVRRHPYSVVLFDEIEKAHPDVFNILLQVLDDGHITDAQGRTVDFKNTIIIMTSNAGAQSIVEPKHLGFTSDESAEADYARMKDRVLQEVRRIFKPEFLNRLDEIIVFHALDKDHMKKIVTLLTGQLQKHCLEQLGIRLNIRDSAKKYIVEKGYDPKYGARPLRRTIQSEIEDRLADEILSGNVSKGDTVIIGTKNKTLYFQVAVPADES